MRIRAIFTILILGVLIGSIQMPFAEPSFAASAGDIFDQMFNPGNKPVDYDSGFSLTRGLKNAYDIDVCLLKKEHHFNETYNVWVNDLVRCKKNSKGVLSKATVDSVSTDPADEQACANKREGEIVVNGTPAEDRAREWSEHCSYLGAVGGAGPGGSSRTFGGFSQNLQFIPGQNNSASSGAGSNLGSPSGGYSSGSQNLLSPSGSGGSGGTAESKNTFKPIYNGPGIQVPDASLVAKGISKQTSLLQLIVFYTNALLPYVSVISVLVFVASGLFYILSFTNEELNGKAKNMMTYVVIGIIIIFSAYTIVNTLLRFATL